MYMKFKMRADYQKGETRREVDTFHKICAVTSCILSRDELFIDVYQFIYNH